MRTGPCFQWKFGILSVALAIVSPSSAMQAGQYPAPNPPANVREEPIATVQGAQVQAPAAAPAVEWMGHKTADNLHPNGGEQRMMWLMNRARQNPTAEGLFLANSTLPDIASGRNFFNVNLNLLKSAFATTPARAPAAFDVKLYQASKAHSNDLIARNAQDHNGQVARVDASNFNWTAIRVSVFAFSSSALNAHAALNIDWGGGPSTGGMQDPPGHRFAIMGQFDSNGSNVSLSNVGLALVPENNGATSVGPLVFSGAYCHGGGGEHNRFIVGTVWEDLNNNNLYDEGEGLGGVTVMPHTGTFFARTADSGGYAIPITSAGTYTVNFFGGDLGMTSAYKQVVVGAESALLDYEKQASDSDGDGIDDAVDNCPNHNNPMQENADNDDIGNICDDDDDNDGALDINDAFPFNPWESLDSDNDGMGNNYEIANGFNINLASDAAEDMDMDGLSNLTEFRNRTNPLDPNDPVRDPMQWMQLLLGD